MSEGHSLTHERRATNFVCFCCQKQKLTKFWQKRHVRWRKHTFTDTHSTCTTNTRQNTNTKVVYKWCTNTKCTFSAGGLHRRACVSRRVGRRLFPFPKYTLNYTQIDHLIVLVEILGEKTIKARPLLGLWGVYRYFLLALRAPPALAGRPVHRATRSPWPKSKEVTYGSARAHLHTDSRTALIVTTPTSCTWGYPINQLVTYKNHSHRNICLNCNNTGTLNSIMGSAIQRDSWKLYTAVQRNSWSLCTAIKRDSWSSFTAIQRDSRSYRLNWRTYHNQVNCVFEWFLIMRRPGFIHAFVVNVCHPWGWK